MESLSKVLGLKKRSLKPIRITKRYPETTTINHISGDSISPNDDDVDNLYIQASGEEEPLSPASHLFHEPTFNLYIIAIMGSKGPINPRVAYEKLPHTLLKHYRFSSLQVVEDKSSGRMKWVPTTVNLNDHIIIPNIPQNLDNPDKFLEDYIYNLSKTSIDSSKPMWDVHLLNLKTSTAEAIGIFRIHHSLGDGISLMSLLLACTRQISNPDAVPTIPTSKNSGWVSYSNSDRGVLWWRRCFMTVYMVFWLVLNTLVDLTYFMATILFLKDTETPLKAPAGAEVNPRRVVYRTVSLDDMKIIKNAMNMTINDVALAITQAGLTRYLDRRYGQGRKDGGTISTEKKNNLPKKKIRLRSSLIVNIRPSSGIQALSDMMEKDTEAKWGNSVSYVLLPFNIGIKDDPLDYVREAKATINRKKHSLEAFVIFYILKLVLNLFGIKVTSFKVYNIYIHQNTHTLLTFGVPEYLKFRGCLVRFRE
ncbi:hypothetical protein OSB04_031974 [Centaurea solstitialis]|uniref:Diacylglycerol O-acyltransferase n=1 Tax=Centaurea solstitialis TaxID=347529 RepID=A0AA38W8M3_9ASTR|nr:hypothetical protein OSB04_031974 [Centaurea solstitialis]